MLALLLAATGLGWRLVQRFSSQAVADPLAAMPDAANATVLTGPAAECDTLVVGGTPAGIAATLAAARRGAKVVLVEERAQLGGDIVYAMLNMFDIPVQQGTPSMAHGIFAEFFDQLGMGFDINRARRLFADSVAAEPNVTFYPRTQVTRITKEGERVTGVALRTQPDPAHPGRPPLERSLAARVVVDATNDASFAARAGAGYYLGRENANPDKRMQAAGLLFSVAGVNWESVRNYVRGVRLATATDRLVTASGDDATASISPVARGGLERKPRQKPAVWLGGIHGDYAWERGDIVRSYRPHGPNMIALSVNFGRQSDGTIVLNTLNIVGVNGLDTQSVQHGRAEAIQELPYFMAHLRRVMPGFAHARVHQIAPELYIRETRHIHGYYALKVEDVIAQRRFFDRIALVSYPLDLHPYSKTETNPFAARRFYYTMPLRCLVPRQVNGVFVASRSLSATYSAAGSARVIPITMADGEAAGAAAWLCLHQKITPHDMMVNSGYVKQLQDSLREWGSDIGDTYPRDGLVQHPRGESPLAALPLSPVRESR